MTLCLWNGNSGDTAVKKMQLLMTVTSTAQNVWQFCNESWPWTHPQTSALRTSELLECGAGFFHSTLMFLPSVMLTFFDAFANNNSNNNCCLLWSRFMWATLWDGNAICRRVKPLSREHDLAWRWTPCQQLCLSNSLVFCLLPSWSSCSCWVHSLFFWS